jgi:hypothetical protein
VSDEEPRYDLREAQGVQLGDHNLQTNIFDSTVTVAAPVEVSWPVHVGAVPRLAAGYQDRAEGSLLAAAVGATGLVTHVLSALGGVGKTQLVAAYARSRTDVDVRLWISAGSRDSIVAGYAEAAGQLGHPVLGDAEGGARWLLAWLQTNRERTWLIVLDDLVDPADVSGLWPDGPNGHVVVTTRRRDAVLSAAPGRGRIDLGPFDRVQARRYLGARLESSSTPEVTREVDELAADLGYLPLALAQAAAYILDRGETCAGYRTRLVDRRRRLVDVLPADALADDYRATTAVTWSISIDAADALAPVGFASPLLQLLSVLDPHGVPTSLLATPAANAYVATHPPVVRARRGHESVEHRDLVDALHNLARFSLVDLDPAAGRVVVHALVQRATVERVDPDRLDTLHWVAAEGLERVWPGIERDIRQSQTLRANAAALIGQAENTLWKQNGHRLLWRFGESLDEWGLVDAAVAYWTRLVAESARTLGPDHVDTLATRARLAESRGTAGDAEGAMTAYAQLLLDCVHALGRDSSVTLVIHHSLCRWQGQAGDPLGAVVALERLLGEFIDAFGHDSPETLAVRGSLAHWRGQARVATLAVDDYEQLLADRLRVLGPDDPATLATHHNLAEWRGKTGDYAGAISELQRLLPELLRVLGPDHPDTLTTRHDLAHWHAMAGDPGGAVTAYQQLLSDYERLLGPDRSETFAVRHNLAHMRGEAGDPGGAVTAYEQLLADMRRVLGPDHIDTISTGSLLSTWRRRAGMPD